MGSLALTHWAADLLGCLTFESGPIAFLPYFLLLNSPGEVPGLCVERHLYTPTPGIIFFLLSISCCPVFMETASAFNLVAQPRAEMPAAGLGCFHTIFFCLVCVIATSQTSSPSVSALCLLRSQDAGMRLAHTPQAVIGRNEHPEPEHFFSAPQH